LGDVRVEAGDIVCGDAFGIVSIPSGRPDDVLARAQEISDIEHRLHDDVARGIDLAAARAAHHYHELQGRR
jgi:regulator of RNase E activity RraA